MNEIIALFIWLLSLRETYGPDFGKSANTSYRVIAEYARPEIPIAPAETDSPAAVALIETQTALHALAAEVPTMSQLSPEEAQEVLDTLGEIQYKIKEEQKKLGRAATPRKAAEAPQE